MNNQIHWMVELAAQPQQEELRALVEEMVNATYKNESGALEYEYHISNDGKVCHLFERYTNADATIAHLKAFKSVFANRFVEIFQPIRFVVYGSPGVEVREALSGFNPVYMESVGGFRR